MVSMSVLNPITEMIYNGYSKSLSINSIDLHQFYKGPTMRVTFEMIFL